jgi:predicted acylesterase/phospholipase RssA
MHAIKKLTEALSGRNLEGRTSRGSYDLPALVISGGGSRGAFAVGVVAELYDRQKGDWFSVIGGSSTGALIAPVAALLGGPKELADRALQTLIRTYTSVSTDDILEKQGLFRIMQHRTCLNASGPLRSLVRANFRREWFEWLQGPEAPECYVEYTNYRTGEAVTVGPRDPGMDYEGFMRAMLASASVPVLMDATVIDGDICYDGGVRDVLPFGRAVELGADLIVPVLLDNERIPSENEQFGRLDRVLYRTVEILVHEVARNDCELARLKSLGSRVRSEALAALRWRPAARRKLNRVFEQQDLRDLVGSHRKPIRVVEGFRPERALSGLGLEFQPEEMGVLYREGRTVARRVLAETGLSLSR